MFQHRKFDVNGNSGVGCGTRMKVGDHVGILVDLAGSGSSSSGNCVNHSSVVGGHGCTSTCTMTNGNTGTIRFFRNGREYGGMFRNVTGPLVLGINMYNKGCQATLVTARST